MTNLNSEVDHYGSQYGNFASDLYAQIRRATFDKDIGQNGWLTAAEQDLFIRWLALDQDQSLLDIACGSGGPTLRIAEISHCRVVGIDIHADAVRTAQQAAADRGMASQATFRHTDASAALPFKDGAFTRLMCIDAINHLPDRPHILAEWYRTISPGGRLVFTDPIVVNGPLTHEEIALRASIGFFLFVPDGSDDAMLKDAGFVIQHKEDRTTNLAEMATRWLEARAAQESDLRRIEGHSNYEGQQRFFEVCARLASERRLCRIAYHALKP